jgi:gamma-glutamyl-gamma-aminobutyrate hydrolase PuuD
MRRPVIGLTTDYNDEKQDRYLSTMTYAGAIEAAGGLPVLLPYAVDQTLIRRRVAPEGPPNGPAPRGV